MAPEASWNASGPADQLRRLIFASALWIRILVADARPNAIHVVQGQSRTFIAGICSFLFIPLIFRSRGPSIFSSSSHSFLVAASCVRRYPSFIVVSVWWLNTLAFLSLYIHSFVAEVTTE